MGKSEMRKSEPEAAEEASSPPVDMATGDW